MAKKTKLLFAAVDIGWRIEHYSVFLKKSLGENINISSFVKHKVSKQQYQTKYTYEFQFIKYPAIVQWIIAICFFIYSLGKFNTFYFFSGETILTRKLRRFEFFIYRLLDKKVIMHFVGSDIRNPNYIYWKAENIEAYLKGQVETKSLSTAWQEKLIEDSIECASAILVSTPDLLDIIPKAIYYPVLIDLEKFESDLKNNIGKVGQTFKTQKVKILHAPSNPEIKGSTEIIRVMSELANERQDFEFLYTKDLKRNTGSNYTVSRYELFQLYQEADIVIDQMIIGWYGLQSIEALLSNCRVVCFIDEHLKQYLTKDCPIVNSSLLDLKLTLSHLIDEVISEELDFDFQKKWVKNNHTIDENPIPIKLMDS